MDHFTDSSNIFAIFGVDENPDSHGQKVVRALLSRGSTVHIIYPFPIGIEGAKSAPTLLELEDRPDVVVIVGGTKKETQATIDECLDFDLTRIWVEPQTGYTDIPEEALARGAEVMTGESILEHLN